MYKDNEGIKNTPVVKPVLSHPYSGLHVYISDPNKAPVAKPCDYDGMSYGNYKPAMPKYENLSFNRETATTYNYDNHDAVLLAGVQMQRIMHHFCESNPKIMAKQLGVTTRTIYNWLAGTRPSESNISYICKRYGVNRKFLEIGEGPMLKDELAN